MQVTVTTLGELTFTINVAPDLELENFKAFCEVESGCPYAEMLIVYNGRPLDNDKKSLKDYGVQDGDVVILQRLSTGAPRGRSTAGAGECFTGRSRWIFPNPFFRF